MDIDVACDKEQLSHLFQQHGFSDYKWIAPAKDIILAQWVRFHCLFGCDGYGTLGCCPPAVPSVEECRQMICEYGDAALMHFPMTTSSQEGNRKLAIRLGKLEREIFLAGYYKVFLLSPTSCALCDDCSAEGTRHKCRNKQMSRPSTEAMGIDVYQTARNAGYPIQVIRALDESINRYGIMLIE